MIDDYMIAVAFGGQGIDVLGVNTVEAYEEKDGAIRRGELLGFPLFSPIYEHSIPARPTTVAITEGEDLTAKVTDTYRELCASGAHVPGKFGDFIQVYPSSDDEHVQIQVSKKAFPKPALATDLGCVIKGKNESGNDVYFLITGTRRADPGKGQPAWLGGFTNLDRDETGTEVLDSFAYTILKEGLEEAGLRIEHDDPESLRRDYDAHDIDVVAHIGDRSFNSMMVNLGLVSTSDLPFDKGGESYSDGTKRVHLTNGFAVFIDMANQYISEEVLGQYLCGGDDIGALQFHDVTEEVTSGNEGNLKDRLSFGIDHHNYFVKPVIEAANTYFIN